MALAIGRTVFLLDGDAFGDFGLVLVVVDGFSVDLDGELFVGWRLKESGDVVGDAHEVDGRGTLVDKGHRGLNLLGTVGTKVACGVGLLNFCFQHFEFLFLESHRTFRGLNSLWQHGVGKVVGEVWLGLCHDRAFLGFPLAVWGHVLVNVMDIEEQVLASLHAHLQLGQVNSKRRTVLKDGLANPVVRALILTDTHVGESSTERIQLTEGHVGERSIRLVGSRSLAGLDGLR